MIQSQFELGGKVALITGGTRGLGSAMSIALAQAGADVATVSRREGDGAVREAVKAAGRKYLELRLDLTDAEARNGIAKSVEEQLGPVAILVNNAGTGGNFRPEVFPEQHWRDVLELCVTCAFDLCQQVFPSMRKAGYGKIINIASIMAIEGGINPAYAAAKHGLAGLTKSLSTSWSRFGIGVNCIAPGYFATELTAPVLDNPERKRQITSRIPCGRIGKPEEIAGLCLYLAAPASDYMHGSIVALDGGWLAA